MAIKEYIVKITDEVINDGFERFEDEYAPEYELIRCKDCEYGREICGNINCNKPANGPYASDIHPLEWFCADGKRKGV